MVNKSTSEGDRNLMYHHGTLRWQPTASVIYQTAKSDLGVIRHNANLKHQKALAKQVGANGAHQGKRSKTAFLYQHLRDASRTSDVLRAALEGIDEGKKKAATVESRLVYQDSSALYGALAIAQAAGD